MQAMDSRAVGIAPLDLAGGLDLLKEIQDNEKLHWLSMNLVDSSTKHPLFAPFMHTRVGSTSLAILGLTDDKAGQSASADYTLLPWQEVLAETVNQASAGSDMVILLSSYPQEVNSKIAETVPGIDLILQSGHSASNKSPSMVKDTLLAQVGARGKYLGMMRINWIDTGKWGQNFAGKIRAEQNRLDRINWQMGRMEKRVGANGLTDDARYQKLKGEKEQALKNINSLKNKDEAAENNPCSFSNRFIGLKSSMPEDREVQAIIDQTTREVNTLNRKRVRSSATQAVPSTLAVLAGWQRCRECHQKQVDFWQTTDHANAWQTLAADNQQFNEDCLLCHVTLPYYAAARVKAEGLTLKLPASLNTVGCESCHEPAAAHSRKPEKIRTILPTEKICKECHTPDHDDNFVFNEKVETIRCPRG